MGAKNLTSSSIVSNRLDNQSSQDLSNAQLIPTSSTSAHSDHAEKVGDAPTVGSGMQLFVTWPTPAGRWPLKAKVDASFQVGRP